jgi:hypothetical protein
LRIDSKAGNFDYTYVVSKYGEREVERVTREYDERPEQTRPYTFESRLDGRFGTFLPPVLLATNLEKMAPSTNPFKLQATKGDVSQYAFEAPTQDGTRRVTVDLGTDGKLYGVSVLNRPNGGGPGRLVSWTLSDYRPLPAGNAVFNLDIPDGFVPFALPVPVDPVWKDRKISFRPSRPTLLALVNPAAPFASELSASLAKLTKTGVPVRLVGPSEKKLLGELHSSMRPFFALVKPDGKVVQTWLGFNQDEARAFETDVQQTTQRAKLP